MALFIDVGLAKSIETLEYINSPINLVNSTNSNEPDASNGLYVLIDEMISDVIAIKSGIKKQEYHIKRVVNSWLEQYNYDWTGVSGDDYLLTEDTDFVRATYGLHAGIGITRSTSEQYNDVNTYPAIYVNNSKYYTETAVFGILAAASSVIRSLKNGEHENVFGVHNVLYETPNLIYQETSSNNIVDIRRCLLTLTNLNSTDNLLDSTNSYQPDASNGLYVLINEIKKDLILIKRSIKTREKIIRDEIDKETMSHYYDISYLDINKILANLGVATNPIILESGIGAAQQRLAIFLSPNIVNPTIYANNSKNYTEPAVFGILAAASTIIRTLKNGDYNAEVSMPTTNTSILSISSVAYDFRDASDPSYSDIYNSGSYIDHSGSNFNDGSGIYIENDDQAIEIYNLPGELLPIDGALSVEIYFYIDFFNGWSRLINFSIGVAGNYMNMDFEEEIGFRWQSRQKDNYDPAVGWDHNQHRLTANPKLNWPYGELADKRWYHLIGTCSHDGDLRLYIDGSDNSTSYVLEDGTTTQLFKLGDGTDNVSSQLFNDTVIDSTLTSPRHLLGNETSMKNCLKGFIRYFRIWNYELSADLVQRCYDSRDNMDRW